MNGIRTNNLCDTGAIKPTGSWARCFVFFTFHGYITCTNPRRGQIPDDLTAHILYLIFLWRLFHCFSVNEICLEMNLVSAAGQCSWH